MHIYSQLDTLLNHAVAYNQIPVIYEVRKAHSIHTQHGKEAEKKYGDFANNSLLTQEAIICISVVNIKTVILRTQVLL